MYQKVTPPGDPGELVDEVMSENYEYPQTLEELIYGTLEEKTI